MDATPKPAPSIVVIGHIDLPKQAPRLTGGSRKPQVARGDRPQRRENKPQNPREVNLAQLNELQFCKHQISSLRADLGGYDDLRAAVAVFLNTPVSEQSRKNLQAVFDAL